MSVHTRARDHTHTQTHSGSNYHTRRYIRTQSTETKNRDNWHEQKKKKNYGLGTKRTRNSSIVSQPTHRVARLWLLCFFSKLETIKYVFSQHFAYWKMSIFITTIYSRLPLKQKRWRLRVNKRTKRSHTDDAYVRTYRSKILPIYANWKWSWYLLHTR